MEQDCKHLIRGSSSGGSCAMEKTKTFCHVWWTFVSTTEIAFFWFFRLILPHDIIFAFGQ